jgi:hypothetical protein
LVKGINVRAKIILLEENMGIYLHCLRFTHDSLNMTPKLRKTTKEKQ